MIRFAENLNKMITAGLGGALEAPSTEVAVGHRLRYMEASGAVASFETNIAAPIRSLRVDMQPIQAGSGDPSPDNIRPIIGRDSVTVWREASYDPSADPALTIPFGQTVYGGTAEIISGQGESGFMRYVLTGDEIWRGTSDNFRYADIPELLNVVASSPDINTVTTARCEFAKASAYNKIFAGTETGFAVIMQTPTVSGRLVISKSIYDVIGTLAGKAFVFPLVEPQTLTLDRATLSTLKGTNNVWSDAGDVTLEYPYYEETEGY